MYFIQEEVYIFLGRVYPCEFVVYIQDVMYRINFALEIVNFSVDDLLRLGICVSQEMVNVLEQYCCLTAPPYSRQTDDPFQLLNLSYLIEVFMPDNTFVRRRYFSCLPPVVSRLQVADYELLVHVTNVVSKEDIKVAVFVCIIKELLSQLYATSG